MQLTMYVNENTGDRVYEDHYGNTLEVSTEELFELLVIAKEDVGLAEWLLRMQVYQWLRGIYQ